jgi:hypothetical protein
MQVLPYKFIAFSMFSVAAPAIEEFSSDIDFFPDFPHPALKATGILIIKVLYLGEK